MKDNVQTNTKTGKKHGKRVILPASHNGSGRWYRKKNLESLAIVQNHGNPNLFITMTCNPNHPQILAAIPHGSTPIARPDIVLRVFRQQVHQLVHVLLEKKIPGLGRNKMTYKSNRVSKKRFTKCPYIGYSG